MHPAKQGPDLPLEPAASHRNDRKLTAARIDHRLGESSGRLTLLKRSIANIAAADQVGLVRIIKRKLKEIQYRPHLIDGCLAGTGLKIEPW